MSQQTESASEMLRKPIAAVEKAHTSLFAQCCSNPIKNAWGKEVSVAMLNDAQEMAVSFSAALRNEQSAALALTDARILEIAMGHFKPGHTVAAEKNFLACVHDILAQAAPQPSAKTLTDEQREAIASAIETVILHGTIDWQNVAGTLRSLLAAEQPSEKKRDATLSTAIDSLNGWIAANAPGGWIDDLREDAERYRWSRNTPVSIGRNGILIENTGVKLDAAVDAARIAARGAAIAKGEAQ
ncbi:hypothetical protein UB46_23515 [Burkholderiaceae bacterium 16]|nr:hypothetical protein UB46_23515 [Burkholderiaceae bacterium 16]